MEKTITGKDLRNVLQVLSIWGRIDLNGKDLVLSDGDIEKGTDEYTLLQNINELYKLIENIEKGEFDTSGIFSEFDKVNKELVRLSENDTEISNKINTLETELSKGIEKNKLDIETINSDIIEIIEMINNNKGEKGDKGDNGKSAYEIAVDNGFQGSEIQWIESLKGKNGEKGDTGEKGLQGIKGDKGEKGLKGDKGDKGEKGDKGIDGKSAYEIWKEHNPDDAWWSENDWLNWYVAGKQGGDGHNGLSAYEIAVYEGFDGTQEEWINSIKGVQGLNGLSSYELYKKNNPESELTEEQWLESLKGEKGQDGSDGLNGLSAYQVAVENGFIGTETSWLESLKGQDGSDGKNGEKGDKGDNGFSAYEIAVNTSQTTAGNPEDWIESLNGDDGKSAYQVAVENGFIGNEEQWLESLKGQDGQDGKDGEEFTDSDDYYRIFSKLREIEPIKEDVAYTKNKVDTIPNLIETVQANVDELATKVTTIQNNVVSISTRQDTVDRDMVQLKKSYSELLKTIDVTTIENLKTQVESNKNDIRNINSDVATVKTDVAKNKTDISTLKTDMTTVKTDVAKNRTDISTLKTDVATLKTDMTTVKTDISTAKTDIATLKTDMTTVKSDIENLKTKKVDVTVFNNKILEIETSLSSINESISQLETKKVDKSVYDAKILEIETILNGLSESITTNELKVTTIKTASGTPIFFESIAIFNKNIIFNGAPFFKQQVSFPAGISVTGRLHNATDGGDALFYDVLVRNNLDVTGQKNAIHPTRDGVLRTGAYETTKTYIGDLRETKLGIGENKIYLNDLFTDIVDLDEPYHVFVSAYSDAKVYVKDREKTYFTIISDKETKASYEIKAVRRGFKDLDYELTDHKFTDMEWLFPKQNTKEQ